MAIVRYLLTLISFFAASFFGRFLGSEGRAIMTTGINLVVLGILLFGFIFLFNFYRCPLSKKYGLPLVYVIQLSILFFVSFFFYGVRIYSISRVGIYLSDLCSVAVVGFLLHFSGEEIITNSDSSGSANSGSLLRIIQAPSPGTQAEVFEIPPTPDPEPAVLPQAAEPDNSFPAITSDDYEILRQVMLGENPGSPSINSSPPRMAINEAQAGPSNTSWSNSNRKPFFTTPDISLENSLFNRIRILESENCLFLNQDPCEKGSYFSEVKIKLNQALFQREYNTQLHFENEYLNVVERKHSCLAAFRQVLSAHPALAENAGYKPEEAFQDFVVDRLEQLEGLEGGWYKKEMQYLMDMEKDINKYGLASTYII
ncbi:uncharacterized protein LOC131177396 [Hevea brasiliensis]|uniref:uncharacterized protein LOC131177396 n=1 Tax=Hevea brasiliensis TaxID=3981 RepID=UPI0025CC2E37|nr:uncharacterized protein LOC131177396 [Hevea brasiliensis]